MKLETQEYISLTVQEQVESLLKDAKRFKKVGNAIKNTVYTSYKTAFELLQRDNAELRTTEAYEDFIKKLTKALNY